MMPELHILISRLKQQPRHGMAKQQNKSTKQYISETEQDYKELSRLFKNFEDSASEALGDFIGKSKQLLKAFTDSSLETQLGLNVMMGVFDAVAKKSEELVKASTWLEQRNAGLTKSFRLNAKEAGALGEQYDFLAAGYTKAGKEGDKMAAGLDTGGEQVRVMATRIEKLLPGMSKMIVGIAKTNNFSEKYRNELFQTNTLLVDHLGLSEDAATNYQRFADASGKSSMQMLGSAKAFADAFESQTGIAGQFGNIINDIANIGEDLQMAYGKMPGNLQLAVVKARLLGIEFKKLDAVAEKMLNIEESVNAELNYQLISGKRLVNQDGESITEKLRIAKLSGNANDMTEAMNELLESQGEILDGNNFYAKQQLAELTGLSVQELTRANNMKKAMARTGIKEGELQRIMELDPAEFADAISKYDDDDKKIFQALKSTESLKSTEQLMNDLVSGKRTLKVVAVSQKQADIIEATRKAAVGADYTGGKGTIADATGELAGLGVTEGTVKISGKLARYGGSVAIATENLTKLGELLPGVNTAVTKFKGALTSTTTFLTGLGYDAAIKNIGKPATNSDVTNKAVVDYNKPVSVDDAVIKFNPQDKIMVASTDPGQLMPAVNQLTGGSGNTAIVDPGPIAAAVRDAMSKISDAMSKISFDITLDGEKLNKSIKMVQGQSLNTVNYG